MRSVLWHCWLGGRKGIRPVKTWVVRYWHGYLSGARCRWFAWLSSWCQWHLIICGTSKIQNGLPFWCQLTHVVLVLKRPLNGCSSSRGLSCCRADSVEALKESKHWYQVGHLPLNLILSWSADSWSLKEGMLLFSPVELKFGCRADWPVMLCSCKMLVASCMQISVVDV